MNGGSPRERGYRTRLAGGWSAAFVYAVSGLAVAAGTPDDVASPTYLAPETLGVATALAPSASAVSSSDCDRPVEVVVGYQQGLPLGEKGANTRANRILGRAFPAPCYRLSFRELHRADVAAAVVDERVSLGLIAVPPPQQFAEGHFESPVIEEKEVQGVSSLPILPPSYSVVTHAALQGDPGVESRYAFWAWGVLSAILGAGAMTACVWLMNIRIPSPWLWREQSVMRLDVRLAAPQRVWGWIFSSFSGGVIGLVWALLGIGLYVVWPRTAPARQQAPSQLDLEGAVRAAYPGSTLQEFRNGSWVRCAQPHECLNDFASQRSLALAGDRELLCYYAKATGMGELRFDPDLSAVPMLQVFLLPAVSDQDSIVRRSRNALLETMRVETGASSPWSSCSSEESVGAL